MKSYLNTLTKFQLVNHLIFIKFHQMKSPESHFLLVYLKFFNILDLFIHQNKLKKNHFILFIQKSLGKLLIFFNIRLDKFV